MNDTENNALIVVIVERGKAAAIVEAARKKGVVGATMFFARGTGTPEHLSFFRINVNPMKEVALILVQRTPVRPIVDAITAAGHLTEPGTGILFTVPVGSIVGLEYLQNGEAEGE